MGIETFEGLTLTNLEQCLQQYCIDFKRLYTQNLEYDDRKATGNLINSIDLNVHSMGYDITVTLSVADYYYYVENGRNAGRWPPIEKIYEWVVAKNITPYPMPNGKLPTQRQLSYLIARKIGEHGYEGKPSLHNTIEELNSEYTQRFQEALQADFGDLEEKILNSVVEMLSI